MMPAKKPINELSTEELLHRLKINQAALLTSHAYADTYYAEHSTSDQLRIFNGLLDLNNTCQEIHNELCRRLRAK